MNIGKRIIDYLKKGGKGKQANKLEREALHDPFLHDALEGYQAADADFLTDLDILQKQLDKQTGQKQSSQSYRWAWAAAVILLIGITGYWIFVPKEQTHKESLALLDEADTTILGQILRESDNNARRLENMLQLPPPPSPIPEEIPVLAGEDVTLNIRHDEVKDMAMLDYVNEDSEMSKEALENEIVVAEEIAASAQYSKIAESSVGMEASAKRRSFSDRSFAQAQSENKASDKVLFAKRVAAPEKKQLVVVSPPAKKRLVLDAQPIIGTERYKEYLVDSLRYPTDAIVNKVEGVVQLAFTIDDNGYPQNIEIVKGLSESCNAEAIRLVRSGGRFIPSEDTDEKTIVAITFNLVKVAEK